jgi:hypothetical protein
MGQARTRRALSDRALWATGAPQRADLLCGSASHEARGSFRYAEIGVDSPRGLLDQRQVHVPPPFVAGDDQHRSTDR